MKEKLLSIDISAPTQKFDSYWKHYVGSEHAALGLQVDWREQVKFVDHSPQPSDFRH